MAASQVQGKAAQERALERVRAMSISTNDAKFNTPLIPASSAALIVHASTRVNAPASLVFRTLRNTETWRDWNNFVPRVTIRSQPKEDDHATDAEIADLILNTSRLGSIDSDLTEGVANPPPKPMSTPPATSPENSRRPSVASKASGRSNDGVSASQRFSQTQAARKASTASGMSNVSTSSGSPGVAGGSEGDAPRPLSPAPAKLVETSSPSSGGVLIHQGTANGRGKLSSSDSRRRVSLNAMYGEPSIRLKVHTAMTFHVRMGLPLRPAHYKDTPLVVTEVSRPDDVQNDYGDPVGGLARSTTHTLSRSGVYRIVWGTDHRADKHPKFMLTSQWVVEVRPVLRGDGKEECEMLLWESMKGISANGIKKQSQGYLFERFQDWVLGLRDYCEVMGGAVERKDFVSSH